MIIKGPLKASLSFQINTYNVSILVLAKGTRWLFDIRQGVFRQYFDPQGGYTTSAARFTISLYTQITKRINASTCPLPVSFCCLLPMTCHVVNVYALGIYHIVCRASIVFVLLQIVKSFEIFMFAVRSSI